jgi:protein-L-isoaspartate(D-aspartate) O-methyltransferase
VLPTAGARWETVTVESLGRQAWAELVYRDDSLVTQLDGHLAATDIGEPVTGFPTASSTMPSLVASMIEDLDVVPGMNVLELGTGTGYSTALLTELLGEDQVTSIEVDPALAERAEKPLNEIGLAPWTYPGDGLLGYPPRAPYDRVIATFAVRRIPYAWVRQTRPDGIILATVGTWAYGTGLAKLTVTPEGTARGRLILRTSFMPARAQADTFIDGDLGFRTAYADSETYGPP